jgi:Tol biopolymer transport system component/DNA-binding winged helix-turn-helix (wHTH) protein
MDSCLQAPKSVRFGLFEADFAAGELRKHGRRVKLQEQPFQVLALLVQCAGQVVPRDELQKALWPADTFVEFDQGVNTAIKKIRQALGDSAENPRFIETLPRKGYRFIAPIAGLDAAAPSTDSVPMPSTHRPRARWIFAFTAVIALAAGAAWIVDIRNTSPASPLIPVPLTSHPGLERHASFSPDGNQVAFAWNGEKQDNFDIYVKLIGSDTLLRITSNPAPDFSPAWSPDGRSIAFLRTIDTTRAGVFVISAIGGSERKLAEIDCCTPLGPASLAWLPNRRWLATADRISTGEKRSVVLVSLDDGEKRRLTFPPAGWDGDANPAFSSDGRQLAFVRQRNASTTELFVLPLSPDVQPNREPIQITFGNRWNWQPAWSPNGSEIVFSSKGAESILWLWRVPFRAGSAPERLASLGGDSVEPAIARGLNRLAYTRLKYTMSIWRVELPARGGKASPPVKLLSSTRGDFNPQYSPDGKRITFHSMRSGWSEIWVADSDGSNAHQLTFLRAPSTGSPRWSPDGNRIVFDSNVAGQFALYTINADGGKPRRFTTNPADDAVASWSRDGRSIYFASGRSGEWQVWKTPVEGGNAIPVTRHGGYVAFESPDGRFVYYSKGRGQTSLWRVPARSGEEQQVLESVGWLSFAMAQDGIFFVPGDAGGTPSIRFFNFRTGAITVVAPIDGSPSDGLSVSPDGRYLLYSQTDQQSSELMLVENFR